jgi:hypothetical protein
MTKPGSFRLFAKPSMMWFSAKLPVVYWNTHSCQSAALSLLTGSISKAYGRHTDYPVYMNFIINKYVDKSHIDVRMQTEKRVVG